MSIIRVVQIHDNRIIRRADYLDTIGLCCFQGIEYTPFSTVEELSAGLLSATWASMWYCAGWCQVLLERDVERYRLCKRLSPCWRNVWRVRYRGRNGFQSFNGGFSCGRQEERIRPQNSRRILLFV